VASFDRDTAHAIQQRAFRDFFDVMASSSPEAGILEVGDVKGLVSPAVPNRSIPNSVVYRTAGGLRDALDELAAAYDEAGIAAWTVWAPDYDGEAIEILEGAGHEYDGQPAAMVLDLAELSERDVGDLDWELSEEMPVAGDLNDRAYGHTEDGYAPAFAEFPQDAPLRIYFARVDGQPASCLATIDHDPVDGAAGPDCGIYWVATPEEFRGNGLSGRLLHIALTEARERGCATSSLQASSMGRPIYEKLGYTSPYRYALYERRRS
jgi:GNAT superfamily N-acetyltransferase